MKSIQTLIAMARAKFHTDRELADALGIKPSELTEMKKGRRPVSPELAAAMCDMLELPGEEAREWVAISVIENPKNAARVEWLKRALFACWVLGVGALTTQTNDAQATEAGDSMTTCTESFKPQAVAARERTSYTLSRLHPYPRQ